MASQNVSTEMQNTPNTELFDVCDIPWDALLVIIHKEIERSQPMFRCSMTSVVIWELQTEPASDVRKFLQDLNDDSKKFEEKIERDIMTVLEVTPDLSNECAYCKNPDFLSSVRESLNSSLRIRVESRFPAHGSKIVDRIMALGVLKVVLLLLHPNELQSELSKSASSFFRAMRRKDKRKALREEITARITATQITRKRKVIRTIRRRAEDQVLELLMSRNIVDAWNSISQKDSEKGEERRIEDGSEK